MFFFQVGRLGNSRHMATVYFGTLIYWTWGNFLQVGQWQLEVACLPGAGLYKCLGMYLVVIKGPKYVGSDVTEACHSPVIVQLVEAGGAAVFSEATAPPPSAGGQCTSV